MELIIRQLEACHLQEYVYRGEGNANLVISLPLARSVLRFRKIEATQEAIDPLEARVSLEWRFFVKFISKFMGRFVSPPEVLYCHPREFEGWNEKVHRLRPDHRTHKNLYAEFAIKLPDYARLPQHLDVDTRKPTFCIEIKPKQGFIPESDRQTQRCPYCIKQHHKISKRVVDKRSNYCPCDLFSGDKTRVNWAIKALLESPQNNLIIFKEGRLVWGEGQDPDNLDKVLNDMFGKNCNSEERQGLIEKLYFLVAEALHREFFEEVEYVRKSGDSPRTHLGPSRSTENEEIKDKTCEFANGNLPRGSILGRLFQMQKMHTSSTDHVFRIYSQHSAHLNEEVVYFSDPSEYKSTTGSIDFNDILVLRNYLLFVTARDCSVLITFRQTDSEMATRVPREHVITLDNNNQTFVFNIGLTDLDPKPVDRIERHRRRAMV